MMFATRVWSPSGDALSLFAHGERYPMHRDDCGWWQAENSLEANEDYSLYIGEEGPFPDPRSAWQPEGVHGPSRVVDHASYGWHDEGWRAVPWDRAVVYELHVGTFTSGGTFESVIDRLPYLHELGVTHIELMPVAEFPGYRGWGYDAVSPFAPHHAYGGPQGLKQLVDACHAHGLGVLLDVIYNHLGPDGNYLGKFAPYFTDQYRTPWGDAVNFDGPGSDEVRRYFIDNARMWIRDYHIDGLRLDAIHAIIDTSALHFLEQLENEVAAMRTSAGDSPVIVIESDRNDTRPIQQRERGGYGLTGVWNEDFHHALHARLTGERQGYYEDFGSTEDIAKCLREGFVYDGKFSPYRHRRHGRAANVKPRKLVGFLQNHDQVGNRATGDRIGHSLSEGELMVGAALVICSPFVPLLFQGEEWNASSPFPYFTDHRDPDLARAVSEGRRREFAAFGWKAEEIPDPQSMDTFLRARLDWNECAREPHARVLDWYRRMLLLRKEVLATGGFLGWPRAQVLADGEGLLVQHDILLVACNLSRESLVVDVPETTWRLRESSSPPERNARSLILQPRSVAVLDNTTDSSRASDDADH